MGVDAKGYCLTTTKDINRVANLVEHALEQLVIKNSTAPKGMTFDENNNVRSKEFYSNSESINFPFTIQGEKRLLHFHFTCDCDGEYEGLFGPKLIFSVSMWGSSEKIIRAVGEALRHLGPVYLQFNDCNDDLELIPPTGEPDEDEFI